MIAIGETLRRERLRRNLDLETVSHELKISTRFLEAIESERFDRLPGGVFAKAFVRQYAHLLGLDEEEMANEVQRTLEPVAPLPPASTAIRPDADPITVPKVEEWQLVGDKRFTWSSSLPALALVVVVMMGCAGVYSWWQRARHNTAAAHATGRAPSQPRESAIVAAAPTPAPPPVQAAAQPAPQPSPATPPAPPEAKPATPADAAAQDADRAASTEEAPASTTPAAAAFPPPNPNAPVRVELVTSEPVWLSARSDGKVLFSGTVDANQTRTLDANTSVVLKIGNAGGVTITLNGKPIGTIGPKGQVRTVQLTSGGFEIVAAPKPPSAPLDPLR
jgi:cytoskeleton protein RodZ